MIRKHVRELPIDPRPLPDGAKSCSKVAGLVNRLCDAVPGEPLAPIDPLDADELPEPYRALLAHRSDMTSTLAEYHGAPIVLRVLNRVVMPQWLARRSVLEVESTKRAVEFGVIRIHTPLLPESARALVLEGRLPLGRILNEHAIRYESCPGGFFRVESDGVMSKVFQLERPAGLYGRCNCLSDPTGRPIAEVIEILPP
jgi:hypothetical protein